MVNDPVLVEKVARAIHDACFPPAARDTAWEDVVWRDCATGQARAALSVIENEMGLASASASPALGKDQVQSEASRHVAPPGYVLVPEEPTEGMLRIAIGAIHAFAQYRNGSLHDQDVAIYGQRFLVGYRAMISAAPAPYDPTTQPYDEPLRHVVPPEWQPIETAPWASTVLVTYFSYDVGEWVIGIACAERPSAPWTHWAYPPPAPGIEAPSEGGE